MSQPRDADQGELARTVARLVRTNAAHGAKFAREPRKKIRPERLPRPWTIQPVRQVSLELGVTLGQGGMGVVRRARQLTLDREVAVKTVLPSRNSEHSKQMLLQEAFVLGRLEHPNILPIYEIRHEGDQPHIVLKKIEGVEWSLLMHRPDVVRDEFAAGDPLEWNLGILMQVCNAVHFAHSRGVIHRDLKPENVMIGQFGEVYVMDWGLAVCIDDDGSGRFPLARDATELAGTPQYMAPEMLGGAVSRISARTDVYLLGATLYEIITGVPPHRGGDMAEMIGQVIQSRPELPPSCPPELARICRKAMDPDPEQRLESAEALRLALHAFLRHAGSRSKRNAAATS